MADDAVNALAQTQPAPAAPEASGTAPAQPSAPVSGDTQTPETTPNQQPEKTFTQADLDRIVAQRLARQQRQFEREQQQRQTQQGHPAAAPEPQASNRPLPENFRTTEEYVEAVAEWKADQRLEAKLNERETKGREARQQEFMAGVERTFREREDKASVAYPDYDAVVYQNPALVVTDPMGLAIKQADNGPDIAHHLGKNPQESQRIARLHPLAQAMEIGKIGARLASTSSTPATSSAPDPIPALRPNGTLPAYDTTDPRSTTMGASAWIRAERERQRRASEGRNR